MKVAVVQLLFLDESTSSDTNTFLKYYQSCITQTKHLQESKLIYDLSQSKITTSSVESKGADSIDVEFKLLINESCYRMLKTMDIDKKYGNLYDYLCENYGIDNIKVLPNSDVINYKIQCWSYYQEDVDLVIYMDLDLLVLQYESLVELIDKAMELNLRDDQIVASTDSTWCDMFNTGLFIIKPSCKIHQDLLDFSEKKESIDLKDQGLLNQYFNDYFKDGDYGGSSCPEDQWIRLSYTYNVMITPRLQTTNQRNTHQLFLYSIGYRDTKSHQSTRMFEFFYKKCKIIHFIVKPWEVETNIAKSIDEHGKDNGFYHQWYDLVRKHLPLEIIRFPTTSITPKKIGIKKVEGASNSHVETHIEEAEEEAEEAEEEAEEAENEKEEKKEIKDITKTKEYIANNDIFPWSKYDNYPNPSRTF